MPARLQTKPSTPLLSEAARHVVVPKGVVSTGWPAVRDKCAQFGVTFRPWQHGAGKIILAKRADGTYASTIGGTGLSIPRQVGKTFLVGGIIFALCILLPNLTVIWTAHRMRTAEETFGKMQVFAKRRLIKPHILRVILGSGEEEIRFRNGSRILFGARERGFGRGFDEIDVLVFDEAQILPENPLDDMIPATNQSRQSTGALLLFLGTPPKPADRGDVFLRMRTEALTGEDDDTGWIEFGADPGFRPTPLPAPLTAADWAQIAKANPSFPHDTPRESILRMRKKLGPESFLREGLGIWDEATSGLINYAAWEALTDPDSAAVTGTVYALDVSLDREWAALALAGMRPDGLAHVSVDNRPGPGVAWVVPRCKELARMYGAQFALDKGSPAWSLEPDLRDAGLSVLPMDLSDVRQACGMFLDAIAEGALRHRGQETLNLAVKIAQPRQIADGGPVFGRKHGDITSLNAACFAHFQAVTNAYDVLQSVL